MAEIKQTKRAGRVLHEAMNCCKEYRHEFIMPEHLLLELADENIFSRTLSNYYPLLPFAEQIE